MPNATFRMSNLSRGKRRSAVGVAAYGSGKALHVRSMVAAASYRSGQSLRDYSQNCVYDYSDRDDVMHEEMLAPANTPPWASDRETFWNAVEAEEKRKDARLARSIVAALPRELSQEQNIQFVREFVQKHFVSQGLVADVAVHDKEASDGGRNPHVHILIPTRGIGPDGFAKTKNRAWNQQQWLVNLRQSWADMQNHYLEQTGSPARVNLQSYEDQGIEKLPSEHLGPGLTQMQQRGERPERAKRNKNVKDVNMIGERLGTRAPASRAERDRPPDRMPSHTAEMPAEAHHHNRIGFFLRDDRSGGGAEAFEHMQRMSRFLKQKAAAYGSRFRERLSSWRERIQERGHGDAYER